MLGKRNFQTESGQAGDKQDQENKITGSFTGRDSSKRKA
jgi:hypothetical protein